MELHQDTDRLTPALAKLQAKIDAKGLSKAKLKEMHKSLDVDLMDYVAYQNLKSEAFAGGKLSLYEANTIYGWLGNVPSQFNKQPLTVKILVTQIIGELLAPKVKKTA